MVVTLRPVRRKGTRGKSGAIIDVYVRAVAPSLHEPRIDELGCKIGFQIEMIRMSGWHVLVFKCRPDTWYRI